MESLTLMTIGSILKDAAKYPFSDWKKILILGIVLLLYSSHIVSYVFAEIFCEFLNISGLGNVVTGDMFFVIAQVLFDLIGILILFFIFGYYFKIVKSSLDGSSELPQFKPWKEMFFDGIKVYIVFVIYLIPLLLFTLLAGSLEIITYPAPIAQFTSYSGIFFGSVFANEWIIVLLTLYLFIIIPVSYFAIANMSNDNGKFSSAFKFREILNKIIYIGLKKLITFYLVAIIPIYLISYIVVGAEVTYLPINLIIAPYLSMFIYRLLALFYMSDKESLQDSTSS